MHLEGSNLYLKRLSAWPDDGCVQRLVVVLLGVRNVVIELAGQVLPEVMNDTERRVALGDVVHEDPNRTHVEDLLETA